MRNLQEVTKSLLGPSHTIQTLHRPSSHPQPPSIHLSHPQEQLNSMRDFTKENQKSENRFSLVFLLTHWDGLVLFTYVA